MRCTAQALVCMLAAAVVAPIALTAPVTSVASAAEVEWFDGTVAEFYLVPDPLPSGPPGELIRVQAVSSTASTTTVRIMYHSRDAQGRDRAVTGMLTHPNAAPPDGGWPVVSHANGTVGLDGHCALSRRGLPVSSVGLPAVAVASDYIGMGPVGERHPYLSRLSEGHSVIDAVRAARSLPGSGAGDRWVAIGGSQGGHGALSAHELGESYAPELDLLGTVAFAPAAMFGNVYGGIDPLVTRVVGAMSLYGAATDYPEIDPHDYVSPAGQAVEGVFDTGCTGEITAAVLSVPFGEYYANDPATTEPARSIMLANDVGHVAVESPVLLIQGTADTTVVPQRTRDLFTRMCGAGQVTEHVEVPGATHDNVGALAAGQVVPWLQARVAGASATSSCPLDPGPFVASISDAACARLDQVAAAAGITRADVVREGVRVLSAVASGVDGSQVSPGPPVDGPCEVTVAWPEADVAAIHAAARTLGTDVDSLHTSGARVILAIVWWLHRNPF